MFSLSLKRVVSLAACLALMVTAGFAAASLPLKVCADPDNLPYSNLAQQGYENRLAEMLARSLHRKLAYRWSRMGRGFVRDILNTGECDVLIEVTKNFPGALTTPAYFSSSYVFVMPRSSKFEIRSFDNPVLKKLKVGVQILDEDYSPPGQALVRRGMVDNLVGFDATGKDTGAIVRAVAERKIDLAILWGPLAGYFAQRYPGRLRLTMAPPYDAPGIPFRYEISMAVRRGNTTLRDQLNTFLTQNRSAIDRVLRSYGVPLLAAESAALQSGGN